MTEKRRKSASGGFADLLVIGAIALFGVGFGVFLGRRVFSQPNHQNDTEVTQTTAEESDPLLAALLGIEQRLAELQSPESASPGTISAPGSELRLLQEQLNLIVTQIHRSRKLDFINKRDVQAAMVSDPLAIVIRKGMPEAAIYRGVEGLVLRGLNIREPLNVLNILVTVPATEEILNSSVLVAGLDGKPLFIQHVQFQDMFLDENRDILFTLTAGSSPQSGQPPLFLHLAHSKDGYIRPLALEIFGNKEFVKISLPGVDSSTEPYCHFKMSQLANQRKLLFCGSNGSSIRCWWRADDTLSWTGDNTDNFLSVEMDLEYSFELVGIVPSDSGGSIFHLIVKHHMPERSELVIFSIDTANSSYIKNSYKAHAANLMGVSDIFGSTAIFSSEFDLLFETSGSLKSLKSLPLRIENPVDDNAGALIEVPAPNEGLPLIPQGTPSAPLEERISRRIEAFGTGTLDLQKYVDVWRATLVGQSNMDSHADGGPLLGVTGVVGMVAEVSQTVLKGNNSCAAALTLAREWPGRAGIFYPYQFRDPNR